MSFFYLDASALGKRYALEMGTRSSIACLIALPKTA